MPEPTPPEQSMDEILASIRKIIADDPPADGAAPDAKADGPLVLTQRVAPPADAAPAVPVSATPAKSAPASSPPVSNKPDKETQPMAFGKILSSTPEHPIVDENAATGAASSFDKLSEAVRGAGSEEPPVHMPAPGRTLEDLTRELLHPLLKSWLDKNLPGIVQARVDEEVERITRRRVG